jgi:ferric-dicitrate binding protein FerR (iron transport regulator)
MDQQRFQYLLDQYVLGEISTEDRQELAQLVEQPEYQHLLDTTLLESFRQQPLVALPPDERVRDLLSARLPGHTFWQPAKVNRMRYWWTAAAAVVLFLAVGGMLWRLQLPDNRSQATAGKVIAPGGDKAILTLANGQQIILDQANNGAIAEQNGVKIIKLSSGQLSYQTSNIEKSNIEKSYNTLTTPRGGQFQLELPDGSQVWLNSATTLIFPVAFTGNTREVKLKGEAYFDIKHKAAQPFIVKAGDVNVQVLGTGFNVMAYAEEGKVATTLVEGAVALSNSYSKKKVVLLPNEQGSMLNGGANFRVSQPDLEQVLAWKNGQFSFEKTDLKAIMRQISRWYNVEVEYKGAADDIDFTGRMSRKEYASQILELLEMEGRVHFEVTGDHITVIPGPATKK